ncbi:PREDICTED: LOW QUALITY PROTEIN: putative HTLV-1-related endogenous sequence [Cercocebus atys]|uniref:LOW QUALITY PROTEIN: putative HTLV-1-related endogenous sequence n=1 Tax=Cercocebus atys TaxID=9531 RepID=UPI0005F3F10D|nr:PREDICTED: LOW QUALITY PROTEIN: putative HTLV-1-related endogenous sequence [Cercocebus atys]
MGAVPDPVFLDNSHQDSQTQLLQRNWDPNAPRRAPAQRDSGPIQASRLQTGTEKRGPGGHTRPGSWKHHHQPGSLQRSPSKPPRSALPRPLLGLESAALRPARPGAAKTARPEGARLPGGGDERLPSCACPATRSPAWGRWGTHLLRRPCAQPASSHRGRQGPRLLRPGPNPLRPGPSRLHRTRPHGGSANRSPGSGRGGAWARLLEGARTPERRRSGAGRDWRPCLIPWPRPASLSARRCPTRSATAVTCWDCDPGLGQRWGGGARDCEICGALRGNGQWEACAFWCLRRASQHSHPQWSIIVI